MDKTAGILLLLAAVCWVSCSKKTTGPAHLQFLSMIPSAKATLTITPAKGSAAEFKKNLSYAEPSGYKAFPPGHYHISYSVDKKTVLSKTFVLGKKSYQTLLIAGMMPDSVRTNPKTVGFKVKDLFAGSENHDPNGFMPQYIMLRDRWRGSKTKGSLRFVNASSLAQTLSVRADNHSLASGVRYPRRTEPLPVKAGRRQLSFWLGKIVIYKEEFTAQKGYVRTVVMGNSVEPNTVLKITSYQTAAEALKKTH